MEEGWIGGVLDRACVCVSVCVCMGEECLVYEKKRD